MVLPIYKTLKNRKFPRLLQPQFYTHISVSNGFLADVLKKENQRKLCFHHKALVSSRTAIESRLHCKPAVHVHERKVSQELEEVDLAFSFVFVRISPR